MDETILTDLVTTPMPYGRYSGTPLYKLPEPYVVWLMRNLSLIHISEPTRPY